MRPLPWLSVVLTAALTLTLGCTERAPGNGTSDDGPAESVGLPDVARTVRGEAIQEHLRTLSADSFAGRGPGTPGGRMAGDYIAEHFRTAGLQPVEGSYFQPVPMVGNTPLAESARLVFEVDGGGAETFSLTYPDDFVIWAGDPRAQESRASGEFVFVGYGITAPENDWDDFGGADLDGKVLLILVNDPPAPPDEPELFGGRAMTYYGRWTYKYEEAARRGAAAAFIIHATEEAGYGWNVVSSSWSGEQFSLPPDPDGPAPVPVQGWVTETVADDLLSAAGLDLERLTSQAASRDFTPVSTGIRVDAGVDGRVRTVETRNVVGLLPGSERPEEVITLTSHYDHLGTGSPVDGDSIYNGAYDNASGTGMLLEIARAMGSMESPPERSLVFIATAAEEQGLLGAAWYVQNPLVPLEHTVAEINMDGANLWGETEDLIAMGAERSELGPFVERRARQLGMELAPDAEPEKGFFFRSDHFPFARAGVPSLYVEHGRRYRGRPPGWGQEIQDDYAANRYHAPADEYSSDFVFDGAVQQARVILLTALDLAASEAWPNWEEGSEFRAARDAMMEGGEDGGG